MVQGTLRFFLQFSPYFPRCSQASPCSTGSHAPSFEKNVADAQHRREHEGTPVRERLRQLARAENKVGAAAQHANVKTDVESARHAVILLPGAHRIPDHAESSAED